MSDSTQTLPDPARPRVHIGAAYYPEHWPENRWPEDIRLMQTAGLTVVRMGEFAWSALEPEEGVFDLDWLERAVRLLAEAGISTVLGTPTAAPPAMLVQKYPLILAVDENGHRVQFGNRCHYCVNSPDFHQAVERIVSALAERFGQNPSVIGWQIDNEYNRVCYCEHCQKRFQEFLKIRFGSLEALNEHWSTRYWSQTYSAWEQIPIPIGPHNPGLMLEFKHFVTASYRKFQKLQLDTLRPNLIPGVWITHNFMNWFDGFDHYEMSTDLDMASWDWYVGTGHHDSLTSGAAHDLVRGYKRRNFWLTETQPGHVNWSPINNELNKGELRAMAWHALAHGAEAILYWQWRSALGGQEQIHGALLDPSGQPHPLFEEIRQISQDFRTASEWLAGSTIKSQVAMLNCYDSRWSIQGQPHHKDFKYEDHFLHYYRSLAARNLNVDILSADEPLNGYKLVIAPTLVILNEKRVRQMTDFVRQGGVLVLTIRSGLKDGYNALLPSRQPGPLAALAGVEVEDAYALDEPVPVIGEHFQGTSILWAERLKILDQSQTVPIAYYGRSNGWLDDRPAITHHPYEKGLVYFVGVYLDEASQDKLLENILSSSGIASIKTPANVEVHQRTDKHGQDLFIVINHSQAEQVLEWPGPYIDQLNCTSGQGPLNLPPYGIALLTTRLTSEPMPPLPSPE